MTSDQELEVRTATYGFEIDQSQHAKSVSQIIMCFIIWLTDFACCDWSIPGPKVAVRTSSSRSPFQNRNNQPCYIINILLASFARSVRQVMDPRFFLPCFHGPRASRLGHKRKEKTRSITCRTDLALG